MATALITGIGGQDASYLSEFLYSKGYRVCGLIHDGHTDKSHVADRLPFVKLVYGNLIDSNSLLRAYKETQADEVYNLGSLSAVDLSFKAPLANIQVTGIGVLNSLEAIRAIEPERRPRFYQASSAEMFGEAGVGPYSEMTPFNPQSPYAAAKVLGHNMVNIYRHAYGVYASSGICFNHESPRRGTHFVSRKISMGVARIANGLQSNLVLGNLASRRDWGFAGDYVQAMWLSLQQEISDDYVISTGESHEVREFVALAFEHAGISKWRKYVIQDPELMRPLDVADLHGDNTKARESLGWEPQVSFEELVKMMVDADLALIKEDGSPHA
jgi:GDPmannose 4,6-dehydratase